MVLRRTVFSECETDKRCILKFIGWMHERATSPNTSKYRRTKALRWRNSFGILIIHANWYFRTSVLNREFLGNKSKNQSCQNFTRIQEQRNPASGILISLMQILGEYYRWHCPVYVNLILMNISMHIGKFNFANFIPTE